ncbi:MAG: hypothetical protein ACO2PP_16535 [Thermocrinis sp.]|jgi:hypothetical protein|uniref:hypothetical protein n=1 Tax=Thermocrinis sp. TaxID=2024383 RepID=UPI003C00E227
MALRKLKEIKIEDVLLGFIVLYALLYPLIIALIIYKSDQPMEDELVNAVVEYFEEGKCTLDGPKGLTVEKREDLERLTAICKRINQEGFELRETELKEGKAVLYYGKKVKGMERKLVIELTLEGDKIKGIRDYEKGR